MREADQMWIYGNYTCRVRNQMGQSDFKIDLHRACKNLCINYSTSLQVMLSCNWCCMVLQQNDVVKHRRFYESVSKICIFFKELICLNELFNCDRLLILYYASVMIVLI